MGNLVNGQKNLRVLRLQFRSAPLLYGSGKIVGTISGRERDRDRLRRGKVGLMGTLADAALESGGEVIGVMPRHLLEKEISHARLAELRIVGSMHARKALMAELSDAFIAMPGGYGTFEEFCEVLTWTQLGLHRKPCGILNVEGYYDQLLTFFDNAVAEEFVTPAHRKMVIADANPESLVPRLLEYKLPVVGKWINVNET